MTVKGPENLRSLVEWYICLAAPGCVQLLCTHEEGMHTFMLEPTLMQACGHIDTGYYRGEVSPHKHTQQHKPVSYMHMYPTSCLVTTLSEIVANQTLLWMINCCTHSMPVEVATGYSYQPIFLKNKSALWLRRHRRAWPPLACPKTIRVKRDR